MRRPRPAFPARFHLCDDANRAGDAGAEAGLLLGVFVRIADRWRLSADDRRALLGVSPATAAAWLGGRPPGALPPAVSARVGHVVGIDLALQAFYGLGSEHAATHVRRPGTAPGAAPRDGTAPDGAGTALAVMRSGLAGLVRVRCDLEQRCGCAVAVAVAAGAPFGARR